MQIPKNTLKAALQQGQAQIGLWMSLGSPYTAEICAGAGFDFVVVDAEHGPNHVPLVLHALQAIATTGTQAVVRPAIGDVVMIKQLLDIGAQTLVVPLIETAEQAELMVRAMRYPPGGIRGVAGAIVRASRWNRVEDYLNQADREMCLIVQVETRKGLDNIEAIAAVEGVDGVFIGPSDLSSSLGFRGKPDAPEVKAAITEAIGKIKKAGKAPGTLWSEEKGSRQWLEMGVTFMAVGSDVALLATATKNLAALFKGGPSQERSSGAY